jgi:hypothetical protein
MKFSLLLICSLFCLNAMTESTKKLSLDGLILGEPFEKSKNKYGAKFNCVIQNDKSKDACFLNNCLSHDEKCMFWKKKSLPIYNADVLLTNKKITKVYFTLDYNNMKPFEARKVLEDLITILGKPDECPMEQALKDSLQMGEYYCAWKGKEEIIRLYPENGKLLLKLESV